VVSFAHAEVQQGPDSGLYHGDFLSSCPVCFLGSLEVARSYEDSPYKDFDWVEVVGFLAALILLAISVICGMAAAVVWWNQKEAPIRLDL